MFHLKDKRHELLRDYYSGYHLLSHAFELVSHCKICCQICKKRGTMSFFDQFTPSQMREGYKRSLEGFQRMRAKAEKKGKYNGLTIAQIDEKIEQYKKLAK